MGRRAAAADAAETKGDGAGGGSTPDAVAVQVDPSMRRKAKQMLESMWKTAAIPKQVYLSRVCTVKPSVHPRIGWKA